MDLQHLWLLPPVKVGLATADQSSLRPAPAVPPAGEMLSYLHRRDFRAVDLSQWQQPEVTAAVDLYLLAVLSNHHPSPLEPDIQRWPVELLHRLAMCTWRLGCQVLGWLARSRQLLDLGSLRVANFLFPAERVQYPAEPYTFHPEAASRLHQDPQPFAVVGLI
jgi:hypothetical protein